ncbi:histone H1-like [Abrus precatorius]|uniref:Histone H1-like n=1 Tax=Abrus precatorius TaxID=3816 RepID=A0A8B8MFU3_ABRPR|nr:histone H1-like [Abrus precatorius]
MAKANAKNKSPSTALHPPYFEMIADAIATLKDRTGSSQPAIAKFIEEKHNKVLPPNFRKLLSLQLKKFVKSEKLYKVKNSYKLSSSLEHQTQKTKTTPKQKGGEKIAEKTKRLSQVKTPEALKKKTTNNSNKKKKEVTKKKTSSGGKVKRLSQVKTPEALKKKKPNLTPTKRKSTPKPNNSSRPIRKARK